MELCRGLEERCKQRLSLVRPELLAPQGRGGGRGGGGWFSICKYGLVSAGVWGDSSHMEHVVNRTAIGA